MKILCYFSGFCDVCSIFQFFNLYFVVISFLVLKKYSPIDGIPTLTQWWGLLGHDPKSYSGSGVATGRNSHAGQLISQTKRDTLVVRLGGWA